MELNFAVIIFGCGVAIFGAFFVFISVTSFWEKLERKSLEVNPFSRFYKAKTPEFFTSSNVIARVLFLLHGLAMIGFGIAIILTGGFKFS